MRTFTRLCLRRSLGTALLLAAWLVTSHAQAQVARYTFSQSTAAYVPLGAGSRVITPITSSGASVGQATLLPPGSIPFPFVFNGTAYTGCYVAFSGYLTFGAVPPPQYDYITGTGANHYRPISEPTGYDGAVAPFGTNLLGVTFQQNAAELRCQTLGVAPNRVFVVQWKNMSDFDAGGYFNFQARLSETTNVIEFAYGAALAQNDGQAQVGLRGSTTNDFINRVGTWASNAPGTANTAAVLLRIASVPANGLVYTYTPGVPQPCPQAFSLRADQLAPTSARLNWRVAGGSGPFTVRYGPAGFDPAVASAGFTATAPAGATSATVSGLSIFTAYDFYVTQNCGGAAGNSPVSAPKGTFSTTLANDDPSVAQALPLTAACQPATGTTLGANATPPNGYAPQSGASCTLNMTPLDVWYTVTTAASGAASRTVLLTATGTGAQHLLVLSSANGPAGPFAVVDCAGPSGSGAQRAIRLALGNLTPATTYYVRVAASGFSGAGPFTICATYPTGCGAPLNPLSTGNTATTFSFAFVPSAGNPLDYLVTMTPTGGTPFTQTVSGSPATVTGLQPSTEYLASVQANCGAGGLSVPVRVLGGYSITPPLNDDPATAAVLPINATCQPVTGSLFGATVSPGRPASLCSRNATGPYDVWYQFTTAASGLPGSQHLRLELASTDDCSVVVARSAAGAAGPFTEVTCWPDNHAGGSGLDLTGLSPGTTYYVQLWGQGAILGPYDYAVCLRLPYACPEPINVAVGGLTASGATVSWALPVGGGGTPTGYRLSYAARGVAPQTVNAPASPATLTNLLPGTSYTVAVQADCGPTDGLSSAAPVAFRTAGAPLNDLCAGAVPLVCGQTVLGNNAGATAAGDPTATCNRLRPGSTGLWYQWQGTTDQTVTLRTCQALNPTQPNTYTQLAVYTGTCAAPVCLTATSTDAACGIRGFAGLSFAALAGQPYYVLLSSIGIPGNFVLATTCGPLATHNAAGLGSQVGLFPNPAAGTATLSVPASLLRQPAALLLRNALGQAVRRQPVPASTTDVRLPLDLTGLAPGVYAVQLTTAQGLVVKRLVVE